MKRRLHWHRPLLRRIRGTAADERGAADVAGIVMIVPLALALVLLLVHVGRQGVAYNEVTHAAGVAARAASMERNAGAAQAAAHAAASATLGDAGVSCSGGPSVIVSATSWEAGGVVTVTVSCTTAGVAGIGAAGRTTSRSARSTIDRYRMWG